MSLLGHLWILSVLVVPLVQVSPEMIISVWFKDRSLFLWTILHNIHTTEFYSLQEKVYLQEGQGHQVPLLLHQNLFDPENVYFLHFNTDFNPVCTKNNVKRGAYHFFLTLLTVCPGSPGSPLSPLSPGRPWIKIGKHNKQSGRAHREPALEKLLNLWNSLCHLQDLGDLLICCHLPVHPNWAT